MTDGLKYHNYLELDTLLSLQKPRAAESAAVKSTVLSEQFFIIAHQASELWLRQVIDDLEAVIDVFTTTDDTSQAEWIVDLLQRAGELTRVLHNQLTALDRLPLRDFAMFRNLLGTASGAQSQQFHRLGHLIGNAEQDGPLYESFAAWVTRSGHTVPDIARRGIDADIYYRIIEALLDIGNGYWRWQVSHISLITKVMGNHAGTGGTTGVNYLVSRCTLPFAELRELRSEAHVGLSVATS
ncbi:tryptophan 2,3-dioxygenase family protein [Streptomyces pratensis]|uniref:tryptophan 2,3-dioxygenase family protein n=1 Tax=Streptomyces pratensis TaxID=1169025 RepID=UPI0019331079|nr:tryptophan 2,3-dioxygenase family protein [Streptomyces pratensis]